MLAGSAIASLAFADRNIKFYASKRVVRGRSLDEVIHSPGLMFFPTHRAALPNFVA
jgi:hypothetical protein